MSTPQVFATTIASPSGPFTRGRYAVDSSTGTTPSTSFRLGDSAASVASRAIIPLADAQAVKDSVADLIADVLAGNSRQKSRQAGSVEVIEPTDGGTIEIRSSSSQAALVDPTSTTDVADLNVILDGIIASSLP